MAPPQHWFASVLNALAASGVDYVLVGGLATNAHGYTRATQDIDLVLRLEEDNLLKALGVLHDLGYLPRVPVPASDFADPVKREAWAREKHMVVFSMIHTEPLRPTVDLFLDYPMPWAQLFGRAIRRPTHGGEAVVCHLDDLIHMKEQAGRPQDLLDLDKLRIIRDARSEKDR
jgi:hypothetical protein